MTAILDRRVSPRTPHGRAGGCNPLQRTAAEPRQTEDAPDSSAEAGTVPTSPCGGTFLAMLAHELRNPLAPIHNALHMLRQGGADAVMREWAQGVLERQTQQLARLIDDLLDAARVRHGKLRVRKEVLNLADVVARAISSSYPTIRARQHRLTAQAPQRFVWVEGDPVRLEQVLVNLLTNAAKYTEPGGTIQLTLVYENDEAVLRIRDTGIGIAPEMLPHIFDLFAQADETADRSQGGLGIGLALVRSFVELHGGSVQASSDGLGQGSEFVVRLPALPEIPACAGEAHGQGTETQRLAVCEA